MGILDNAKDIAGLIKQVGDIDLYRKIVELQGEIVELSTSHKDLFDENKQLKEALEIRGKLTFRKPAYYLEDDPEPYCPACWDDKRKLIHIMSLNKVSYPHCPVCGTSYNISQ
jgi:hypothetical protein